MSMKPPMPTKPPMCEARSASTRAFEYSLPAEALTLPAPILGYRSAERLKRYKAGRVIEFLSISPEFEDLQQK
jgi:hypothetical protein